MTWEYRDVYMRHPAHFSDLGEEGWELVAMSNTDTTGNAHFYFKRVRAAPAEKAAPGRKKG